MDEDRNDVTNEKGAIYKDSNYKGTAYDDLSAVDERFVVCVDEHVDDERVNEDRGGELCSLNIRSSVWVNEGYRDTLMYEVVVKAKMNMNKR